MEKIDIKENEILRIVSDESNAIFFFSEKQKLRFLAAFDEWHCNELSVEANGAVRLVPLYQNSTFDEKNKKNLILYCYFYR